MLPLKKQTHDRHMKLQATVDGSEIILDTRESKPALEVEWAMNNQCLHWKGCLHVA